MMIQSRTYSLLLSGNYYFKTFRTIELLNSCLPKHARSLEITRYSHSLSGILVNETGIPCLNKSAWSMVRSRSSKSVGLSHSKELTTASTFKSSKSSSSSGRTIKHGIKMKVIPIRALQDNYMYLLIDEVTLHAAAVDPVNASAIAHAVSDQGVDLKAILTTHHHYDHAHGNADMLTIFPDLVVYGGDSRVQALTKSVSHGDTIKLGSLSIECLSTPCHTRGHICYYVTSETESGSLGSTANVERAVFTGDTLFIAGCGRFFEGSSDQMDHNLNFILGNLPSDTRVWCGHEYTVTNLKFALTVEPQNMDIKSKLTWAQKKIDQHEPTVPSTIGEEKKINPFMRIRKSQVKKFTGETDDHEVMAVLRHRKNEFQP